MEEGLIRNLSDPLVVKERFIETLVMKRQLAGLLKATGSHEEAIKLIDGAIPELYKALASENKSLKETVRDLKATFVELKRTTDDRSYVGKINGGLEAIVIFQSTV